MPTTRAIVLTDVPDVDEAWHHKQIASTASRLSATAQLCEKEQNGFEDIVKAFEEQYMTLYDFPETTDLAALEQRIRVEDDSTPPKGVRFDARFLEEIRRVETDDYAERKSQTKVHIVTYFRPRKGTEEATLAWLCAEVYPALINDPNMISVLVYKVSHSTLFADGVQQKADFEEGCDFVSVFEMTSDELPWEALVIMGQSEGWGEFMDGCTRWCGVQFAVKQTWGTSEVDTPIVNGKTANGTANGHVAAGDHAAALPAVQ
ncbi:hypothetical protein DM02DRAFT_138627 [Periconia macrospinosa]|uniref:Uncharacterized protein n=1 Tax=Periconia macrospinosa TaxID=97972 RepID=A0A2V1DCF5_9PLEO|nr:hypothetical protein DM02DRAFT_138627 [Periconia macrospinosa]